LTSREVKCNSLKHCEVKKKSFEVITQSRTSSAMDLLGSDFANKLST
jgi:hypothetical protein